MDPRTNRRLTLFFEKYKLLTYKKGELIYRPGDNFSFISYIKSGYVRMYAISKDGEEKTIHIFKPVFYFSLIYAITDIENKYYFEAITPVELWRAPKEEVLAFIKSDAVILFEITKNILSGFREILTNIEYLISGSASTKVASILLSLVDRFGKKQGGQIILDVATTHRIIASLTGLTRETTSIQMEKLQKKGIITRRGNHLVIRDLQRMKEESSAGD